MKKYDLEQLKGAWGAGYGMRGDKNNNLGLVGKWFHSVDKKTGDIHWQGQVLAIEQSGYFSVQLYSFIDGRPTVIKLIPFQEMVNWIFYVDNEEMRLDYSKIEKK